MQAIRWFNYHQYSNKHKQVNIKEILDINVPSLGYQLYQTTPLIVSHSVVKGTCKQVSASGVNPLTFRECDTLEVLLDNNTNNQVEVFSLISLEVRTSASEVLNIKNFSLLFNSLKNNRKKD